MIRLRRSHFLDSDPEPATVDLRRSRQFILGLLLGVNILVLRSAASSCFSLRHLVLHGGRSRSGTSVSGKLW